VTKNSESKRY